MQPELIESEKAKRTRKHYDDRIDAAIQSAMALSTKLDPTEPLYDNINVSAADWAAQQGRIEEQGKILRAFYQTHTKDPVARLVMAKFLEHQPDPKDRAEAIAILSEQIDPEGRDGLQGRRAAEPAVDGPGGTGRGPDR